MEKMSPRLDSMALAIALGGVLPLAVGLIVCICCADGGGGAGREMRLLAMSDCGARSASLGAAVSTAACGVAIADVADGGVG